MEMEHVGTYIPKCLFAKQTIFDIKISELRKISIFVNKTVLLRLVM